MCTLRSRTDSPSPNRGPLAAPSLAKVLFEPRVLLLLLVTLLGVSCVRAPDTVYLVDKMTVLEHQASGEFVPLENELRDAALKPSPETFTGAQLEAAGYTETTVAALTDIYRSSQTDEGALDELLLRRCVGEALTGLLLETPESCIGVTDPAEVSERVARANRLRRQLWAYLKRERPKASEEEIRTQWREAHLLTVLCGGQLQEEDGSWGVKQCLEE